MHLAPTGDIVIHCNVIDTYAKTKYEKMKKTINRISHNRIKPTSTKYEHEIRCFVAVSGRLHVGSRQ